MQVEVLKNIDSEILKESWDIVLASNENNNIHLTYEWLKTWWEFYGHGRELFILLVKDNANVVGIIPLMITSQQIFPGIKIKRVEFIGTGLSDYHDFIIKNKKPEVVKAVFEYLKKCHWHVIKLRQFSENSENLKHIRAALTDQKNFGWRISDKEIVKCPYISLDDVKDNFLNSIGKNLRYDVKRKMRKFNELGNVKFESLNGENENILQYLEPIYAIHQKSWERKNERCAFSFTASNNRDFFRKVTEVCLKRKWINLFALSLNDQLVAYIYCFAYDGKIYHWNTSFDPKYFKYSVGKILHKQAIEDAIAKGYTEFDFMRGDEDYKMKWTKKTRNNYEILITQSNLFSLIAEFYYRKLKPFLEENKIVQKLLSRNN